MERYGTRRERFQQRERAEKQGSLWGAIVRGSRLLAARWPSREAPPGFIAGWAWFAGGRLKSSQLHFTSAPTILDERQAVLFGTRLPYCYLPDQYSRMLGHLMLFIFQPLCERP